MTLAEATGKRIIELANINGYSLKILSDLAGISQSTVKNMIYNNIVKALFKNRQNRFIAECNINNENVIVHVKNTGRCRELLVKDAEVYLEYFPDTDRKTKYDLITVNKIDRLINMDSSAPNKAVYEALQSGKDILHINEPLTYIKMEYKYKQSRFDVYAEKKNDKIFAEIKGVKLEENNIVMLHI